MSCSELYEDMFDDEQALCDKKDREIRESALAHVAAQVDARWNRKCTADLMKVFDAETLERSRPDIINAVVYKWWNPNQVILGGLYAQCIRYITL